MTLSTAISDLVRDCFCEGYALALKQAEDALKQIGVAGGEEVFEALRNVPAELLAMAAIAKATGASSGP